MLEKGELFDENEVRNVFYLIVGRKKTKPAPQTKVCLITGSVFESISTTDTLIGASSQALDKSIDEMRAAFEGYSAEEIQSQFAKSREVEGSSIKLRFRVMAEVSSKLNLLSDEMFPKIKPDSISLITNFADINAVLDHSAPLCYRYQLDEVIRHEAAFVDLCAALDDLSPSSSQDLQFGTLLHLTGRPFFIAQMPL